MAKIYSIIPRVASVYDQLLVFVGYKSSVEAFISSVPFSADQEIEVLDAGCGTGLYTEVILNKFKLSKVSSFDLNEDMIYHLRAKLHGSSGSVNLFCADVSKPILEISERQFDLIITAGVLEYVPIEAAIRNLSQYLKVGGYFLSSPVRNTCLGRLVCFIYGCKPYEEKINVEVFTANGFILERKISLPWYLPASFKEAYLFKKTSSYK